MENKGVKEVITEILLNVNLSWTNELDLSLIFSFYWITENDTFIFNPDDVYKSFKNFVHVSGIKTDRDINYFVKTITKESEDNLKDSNIVGYFYKDNRFDNSYFLSEKGISRLEELFPKFSFRKFFEFAQENG